MKSNAQQQAVSVDDYPLMHTRFLEMSLRQIGDGRAGKAVKEDVMSWIREEGVRPFSFDACCIFAGVNPSKTRDAVERLVKRLEAKKK